LARIVQGWDVGRYRAKWRIEMPMRGELPTITTRAHARASQFKTAWSRLSAVLFDPELHTIVAFSLIGLLVMLNAVLRFPDFGQTFTEFAFP
jgi:hypothetical protein